MNVAGSHPVRSEKDFTARVRYEAELAGWELVYHTYDSRRSERGFPDLVMVRPPRLIFAELKMKKGKLTVYQEDWIAGLKRVPDIEVYIWRYPEDIDTIIKVLS